MAEDLRYTIGELWAELGRFEEDLRGANVDFRRCSKRGGDALIRVTHEGEIR